MGLRWIEDGEQSGWMVESGSERRLFVARKFGGKEATRELAAGYEQERAAALQAYPDASPAPGLWARFMAGLSKWRAR